MQFYKNQSKARICLVFAFFLFSFLGFFSCNLPKLSNPKSRIEIALVDTIQIENTKSILNLSNSKEKNSNNESTECAPKQYEYLSPILDSNEIRWFFYDEYDNSIVLTGNQWTEEDRIPLTQIFSRNVLKSDLIYIWTIDSSKLLFSFLDYIALVDLNGEVIWQKKSEELLAKGYYLIPNRFGSSQLVKFGNEVLVPFGGEWEFPNKRYPLDMRFLVKLNVVEAQAKILDYVLPDFGTSYSKLDGWAYTFINNNLYVRFAGSSDIYKYKEGQNEAIQINLTPHFEYEYQSLNSESDELKTAPSVEWSDFYFNEELYLIYCFSIARIYSPYALGEDPKWNNEIRLHVYNENLEYLSSELIKNTNLFIPIFQRKDEFLIRTNNILNNRAFARYKLLN